MKPLLGIALFALQLVLSVTDISAQSKERSEGNSKLENSVFAAHDIEAIYNDLTARFSAKGKFESTAEYQIRIQRAALDSVLGKFDIRGQFIFQTPNLLGETIYDADRHLMTVSVNLEDNRVPEGTRAIVCAREMREDKYEGINAMGAKIMVTRMLGSEWDVAFSNYQQFAERYVSSDLGSLSAIVLEMSMDATTARRVKNDLRVAIVVRLTNPYVFENEFNYAPTFRTPQAMSIKRYFLRVSLLEVWVYYAPTGDVLAKKVNVKRGS